MRFVHLHTIFSTVNCQTSEFLLTTCVVLQWATSGSCNLENSKANLEVHIAKLGCVCKYMYKGEAIVSRYASPRILAVASPYQEITPVY